MRRSRFLRQLEGARIKPTELHQRLAASENYEHRRLLASSERILAAVEYGWRRRQEMDTDEH